MLKKKKKKAQRRCRSAIVHVSFSPLLFFSDWLRRSVLPSRSVHWLYQENYHQHYYYDCIKTKAASKATTSLLS
jgi:hypothetical protein